MIQQGQPDVKLSINSVALESKPGKDDPVWKQMANTWVTTTVSPGQLSRYVIKGHSFSAALTSTYRSTANFESIQHVCLDFDTEDDRSSIPALLADPFISKYASFIYTTMSHTPEKPRARAVFVLSHAILDYDLYRDCMSGLLSQYPDADQKCKDAVRWHLGSHGCSGKVIGSVLPIARFLELGAKHRKEEEQRKRILSFVNQHKYNNNSDTDTYHGKLGDLLVSDVENAQVGNRNNTFYTKGVKARARLGAEGAMPYIDRMRAAMLSKPGVTEHEVETTYQSILRSSTT